ncbi:MAG: N-6 DNA methylase [Rhodoferax sp.]|nr:N-6 DNA methylase [Rhodoferax sp.]
MYKKQAITKDQGRTIVAALVEEFKRAYVALSPKDRQSYNETTVRQKFIDHFFAALGWAITDDDVQLEYAQKRDDDSKGRADYAFGRSAGKSFFVEAKKPYEPLDTCVRHALQARLYGYNADHPVVILTDFEEFSVYLGRGCEPRASDAVNTALVTTLTCKFTDYQDKWEVIWDAFSRERVMAGSLENLPGVQKASKGSKTVDDLFLADIEQWRQTIATDLHRAHPDISRRALNEATQKTIDRIIFLRICEDREIEDYGRLLKIANLPGIYNNLCKLFTEADARYNSGLFHFKDGADQQHLSLQIADAPLQALIHRLYFPGGPYAFAVMPADILGQVYERFLGKVIEITPDGGVAVQDKPEVKKAGGVFYTPEYIVSYIVENTLGPLLAGKTPADIARLKALDPACGSGAFLINVYQYLLDWHLAWYVANKPEKWAKEQRLVRAGHGPDLGLPGTWQLTLHERKRILLAHIHGVDIDTAAVEVTRLSLLLKCLEGETQRSLQLGLFDKGERILPDLDRNIKCGNSLIGRDFYDPQQTSLFDREAKLRINAFDWEVEFADIMAAGGFDVVVGNPPYVRQESLSDSKEYFKTHYASYHGVADLYVYFIEKGIQLLKPDGYWGVIVSSSFLRTTFAEPLRGWLLAHTAVERIVDFGGLAIFSGAKDTYVCIPILRNAAPLANSLVCEVTAAGLVNLPGYVDAHATPIPRSQLTANAWSLKGAGETALFAKIVASSQPLGDYLDKKIFYGVKTGLNEAFVIDAATRTDLIAQDPKSAELIKPLLGGEDIRRYATQDKSKSIIVIPTGWTREKAGASHGATENAAWAWFAAEYSALANHLSPFTVAAQKRQDHGDFWWELRPCVYYQEFERPKIIYPDIAKFPRFVLDTHGHYLANTAYCLGTDSRYLLGILNSRLFWFAIGHISIPFGMRAGEYRYRLIYQYMEKVPVRRIDASVPAQQIQHDAIVQKVSTLLALTQELQTPGLDSSERRSIEQDIAATDRAIDRLVYQLYDLSAEEISLLEATTPKV